MVTICSLVARHGGTEDQQVQDISDRLVDYARRCMKSKTRVSPFERGLRSLCQCEIIYLYLVICTGEAARQGMFFRGGVRL